MSEPTRALVLSGGGARGAYEVGVLSYLFNELPPELVRKGCIQVLCGTSVGAINAGFLAATAHVPSHNIERLVQMWTSLRLKEMLRLTALDLLRMPTDIRKLFKKKGPPPGVIVNVSVLQRKISEEIPWHAIRQNLADKTISGLTVTATHIESGRTVVFVDKHEVGLPPWSRDKRVVAKQVHMAPVHALASAAIPFLFPAVRIDGAYYCDGGLRQNTPISPALRLGADRALVIGLRYENAGVEREPTEEDYPGPFAMLGKVLDSVLLDHLDYDIARLEGFNKLLRDGRKAFGPSFDEQINSIAQNMRGISYREVRASVIRPSRDIGEMATEFVHLHRSEMSKVMGWILGRVASSDFLSHSDFLSYFLFDGRFAEALIELGRADADAERQKLIDFLKD